MSKKESNPMPPKGAVKPPPPPAAPKRRVICDYFPNCDMWYLSCDKCGYGNKENDMT